MIVFVVFRYARTVLSDKCSAPSFKCSFREFEIMFCVVLFAEDIGRVEEQTS